MVPCAIGKAGISHRKREGDSATPAGNFAVLNGYFRPDRMSRPLAHVPLQGIRPRDGWCDDPASGQYNRPVQLPFAYSHETLSRADHVYDIVLVLDFNLLQRVKGCGSAIFFHLANMEFAGTAGCIAIKKADMQRLLPRLSRKCRMLIGQLSAASPKNGAAHPDMRRAQLNRQFKVAAHAH